MGRCYWWGPSASSWRRVLPDRALGRAGRVALIVKIQGAPLDGGVQARPDSLLVVARQLLHRHLLEAKFFALGLLLADCLRQLQAEFLDLRCRGVRRDRGGEGILRRIGASRHVSRGVATGPVAEIGGVFQPVVEVEDPKDGGVLEVSHIGHMGDGARG